MSPLCSTCRHKQRHLLPAAHPEWTATTAGPSLLATYQARLSPNRFPSDSARNRPVDDATRCLDGEAVISYSDGPRRRGLLTSNYVTNQSLNELDTLADCDDELPSLTDILSRARPVASRVGPQVIDLMIDSSDVS